MRAVKNMISVTRNSHMASLPLGSGIAIGERSSAWAWAAGAAAVMGKSPFLSRSGKADREPAPQRSPTSQQRAKGAVGQQHQQQARQVQQRGAHHLLRRRPGARAT